VPAGQSLAVSLDTLVAGRHFPLDALPQDIATRAFCVCLSDLAAMGATPQYYTLGLTLPTADESWLQAFSESLHAIADQYQCELIGGDTTQGALTISLQVHGTVSASKILRRDMARAGDSVYVTHTLGDGAAALSMLQSKQVFTNDAAVYLKNRFYRPEPQISAGQALGDIAHAAIDISDGLLADLQHIAQASDVDILVDIERIPLSAACQLVGDNLALQWALTGGDDYQLAFTVPVDKQLNLMSLISAGELNATLIGHVQTVRTPNKPAVHCQYHQQPWQSQCLIQGFDHFAS